MARQSFSERIRLARQVVDIDSIARRYFVIGSFDGSLTMLGVILAAWLLGAITRNLVVLAAFSGGLALGVSAALGAYEAERVERRMEEHTLKRSMLREVSPEYRAALDTASLVGAVVHGLAPVGAALIPVIPYLYFADTSDGRQNATIWAVVVSLGFLFSIGSYLGSMAKQRAVVTGLRFVGAGLLIACVVLLLGNAHF